MQTLNWPILCYQNIVTQGRKIKDFYLEVTRDKIYYFSFVFNACSLVRRCFALTQQETSVFTLSAQAMCNIRTLTPHSLALALYVNFTRSAAADGKRCVRMHIEGSEVEAH
jgi:hypothetical protein